MRNWNSNAVCTRMTKDDCGNLLIRLWNDTENNVYLDEWINGEFQQTKISKEEKAKYLKILHSK